MSFLRALAVCLSVQFGMKDAFFPEQQAVVPDVVSLVPNVLAHEPELVPAAVDLPTPWSGFHGPLWKNPEPVLYRSVHNTFIKGGSEGALSVMRLELHSSQASISVGMIDVATNATADCAVATGVDNDTQMICELMGTGEFEVFALSDGNHFIGSPWRVSVSWPARTDRPQFGLVAAVLELITFIALALVAAAQKSHMKMRTTTAVQEPQTEPEVDELVDLSQDMLNDSNQEVVDAAVHHTESVLVEDQAEMQPTIQECHILPTVVDPEVPLASMEDLNRSVVSTGTVLQEVSTGTVVQDELQEAYVALQVARQEEREAAERALQTLQLSHATSIEELQATHAAKIEQLEAAHAAKLSAISAAHIAGIRLAGAAWGARVHQVANANSAEIGRLKAEAGELREEVTALRGLANWVAVVVSSAASSTANTGPDGHEQEDVLSTSVTARGSPEEPINMATPWRDGSSPLPPSRTDVSLDEPAWFGNEALAGLAGTMFSPVRAEQEAKLARFEPPSVQRVREMVGEFLVAQRVQRTKFSRQVQDLEERLRLEGQPASGN